jgi:hypothetical protein
MTFDQVVHAVALVLGWSESHVRYEIQRVIDSHRVVIDVEAVRASLQQIADGFATGQVALGKEYREPAPATFLFPAPKTAELFVHENARRVPQQPSTYG